MSSNDKDGNLRDATRDFKRKILCGDIKEEKLIGLILHDRGERGVIILRGFNFYMTGLTLDCSNQSLASQVERQKLKIHRGDIQR